jgi:hypothetical protein
MSDPSADPTPWWGAVSLDLNAGGEWHVGPTTLWVHRSSRDWRVVVRPSTDPVAADPMAQRSGVTVPVGDEALDAVLEATTDDLTTFRLGVQDTNESVALRPALADRPVVARPEHALSVLPDEKVTLYLSTPLWVRVELVESGRRLVEVPSHRMSDTWFGPSTREGTLCYATRTAGRLHRDRLPRRLHRALTPLTVRNQTAEPLALERVQLPAPHLSLYETDAAALWTDPVTMTHRTKGEGAAVQVREGPPAAHPAAEPIQAPREAARHGLFTSTFSAVGALFGP